MVIRKTVKTLLTGICRVQRYGIQKISFSKLYCGSVVARTSCICSSVVLSTVSFSFFIHFSFYICCYHKITVR